MRHLATTLSTTLVVLLAAAACSGPAREGAPAPPTQATGAGDVRESVAETTTEETTVSQDGNETPTDAGATTEVATFGAGCFWCVEAVLEQLDGVRDVTSGYMGGHVPDPTYEQVCTGATGHAEVVQVTFDPSVISYDDLLDWFWRLHDPTTPNRQGADVGPQYRSAIFVHSAAQRAAAERSKSAAGPRFDHPIVTEIAEASEYYVAEDHHQDYYRLNSSQGYCRAVIAPKLEKLGLED